MIKFKQQGGANRLTVLPPIWFSYTDKSYIKMMKYKQEINWNLHPQHSLLKFKVNNKNNVAAHAFGLFLFKLTAEHNWHNNWKCCWCYSSLFFLIKFNLFYTLGTFRKKGNQVRFLEISLPLRFAASSHSTFFLIVKQ